MLHAAGSQLQTVGTTTWHCGVEAEPVEREPSAILQVESMIYRIVGAEFNSSSYSGNILRERCRTLWELFAGGKKGVRKQRRDCWAEDAAVTETRAAYKLEISPSVGVVCWRAAAWGLIFLPLTASHYKCSTNFLKSSRASETQSAVTRIRTGRGVLHNFDP